MVFDKVVSLIAEHFNVKAANINNDTSFVMDLNADSLDMVELIMAFEEEFDVQIEDGDLSKIKTISDVVEYIEGKK